MKIITIKQWQLAALFFAVAFFTACQKEPDAAKPEPTVRPRLTKIEQNARNFMIFGYTSKGYLNKFKAVNDNLTSEAHFGYDDADNKLIAATWDGFELEFSYKNGLLDRVYFSPTDANPLSDEHYLKFTYANGRVSETIDYVADNNGFSQRAKHVYGYYPNGDMKTETYYYSAPDTDGWAQLERNVYEYDEQINPLQIPDEIAYVLYLNKSAHNVKKIINYDASDALDETKSYSTIYNGFGLPTTTVENTTYPNSPAINRTLTYSYQ